MKRFILIAFVALTGLSATAQKADKCPDCSTMPVLSYDTNAKITYKREIKSPGMSSEQLYDIARTWYAINLQAESKGLSYAEDVNKTKFVSKGTTDIDVCKLDFTMSFAFEEGKMLVEVTGIKLYDQDAEVNLEYFVNYINNKPKKRSLNDRCKLVNKTDETISQLFTSLESEMVHSIAIGSIKK
ncbi:DUF4468 domain-containing protein [Pontibacter sp. SGAir0037]|uniref:DUF4468 domain-containing protein n=1 Tax=Pontibacter sp. SGAir0037 TaxID=2571030 RepID=UPI0010CD42D4|nr:DUF4468 domain-containing protein [Pontibacter sp. SGAir0037]QCR20963.1 hypothetical protein C1N53_00340 [Pontibacter sp. SGAir0037]